MSDLVAGRKLVVPTVFGFFSLLLLVAVYFSVYFENMPNIPVGDDYIETVRFYAQLASYTEFSILLDQFFAAHNEHHVLFSRLVYSILYFVEGEVNFITIAFVGNFLLVFIWFVYFKVFLESNWWLGIPAAMLIFNPMAWEVMFWAMAVISNYSGLLFALAAFAFSVSHTSKSRFLSCVFAWLSALSFGSGILVFPLLLLCWVHQQMRNGLSSKKELVKIFLVWGLVFFNASLLVFVLYPTSLNTSWEVRLEYFYFPAVIRNYAAVLGSALAFGNVLSAQLIGFFLSGVSIVLLFVLKKPRFLACYYYMVYLLASVFILAANRSVFGVYESIPERYQLYSIHYIIALLAVVFSLKGRLLEKYSIVLITVLLGCLIVCVASFWTTKPAYNKRIEIANDTLSAWVFHKEEKLRESPDYWRVAWEAFDLAISAGLYDPWENITFSGRLELNEGEVGCPEKTLLLKSRAEADVGLNITVEDQWIVFKPQMESSIGDLCIYNGSSYIGRIDAGSMDGLGNGEVGRLYVKELGVGLIEIYHAGKGQHRHVLTLGAEKNG